MQKPFLMFLSVLLLSCRPTPEPISIEFRIAEREASDSLMQMVFSGWGNHDTFYVHPPAALTERMIVAAEVTEMNDHPAIAIEFSDEGREIMADLTAENVNKRLAMIIDGTLVSAPLIRATITGGRAIINGEFSAEQAADIAGKLDQN